MKQTFDSKQARINDCGNGLVVLMTNEEKVIQQEQRQTGVDSYETVDVERWQYEVIEVAGVSPVNEETIANALKKQVVKAIEEYDTSEKVNSFVITYDGKEYPYWLNVQQRNNLTHSVGTWQAVGNDSYSFDLRQYGMSIKADCKNLLTGLSDIENYAVQCYNTTTTHIKEVEALNDIEALVNYDVTVGYPEKIIMEL